MREKRIKNFFFIAFLFVPFQNGTVLFTCGKNYEIWNISKRGFFGVWCAKYLTFGTSAVNALRSKKICVSNIALIHLTMIW